MKQHHVTMEAYSTVDEYNRAVSDFVGGRNNSVLQNKKLLWKNAGGCECDAEGKTAKEIDEMLKNENRHTQG